MDSQRMCLSEQTSSESRIFRGLIPQSCRNHPLILSLSFPWRPPLSPVFLQWRNCARPLGVRDLTLPISPTLRYHLISGDDADPRRGILALAPIHSRPLLPVTILPASRKRSGFQQPPDIQSDGTQVSMLSYPFLLLSVWAECISRLFSALGWTSMLPMDGRWSNEVHLR